MKLELDLNQKMTKKMQDQSLKSIIFQENNLSKNGPENKAKTNKQTNKQNNQQSLSQHQQTSTRNTTYTATPIVTNGKTKMNKILLVQI